MFFVEGMRNISENEKSWNKEEKIRDFLAYIQKGRMLMKRLKNKLLAMEPNTVTYKEMYEGGMLVADPSHPTIEPWAEYDPTYYYGEIGFHISCTHKLAQDKPTVTISIPCKDLGIEPPPPEAECALADFCLRVFGNYMEELNQALYNRGRPDEENGRYELCRPGGEILQRNAAYFAECIPKDYENGSGSTVYILTDRRNRPPQRCLCLRLQVQLPRRKLRKAIQMLCRDLPDAVDRFIVGLDRSEISEVIVLAKQQHAIRTWLSTSEFCAFIANGSILPRSKGSDLPMRGAVPFLSTPKDEVEVCGVRGMGIRKGVTVITGGGYSGKSTLLDAIAAGIYDHVLGDGRELCITDGTAVTIAAEDGRSVRHLNISPFIQWLPNDDPRDFSTDHASGSTSQAANIMEAVHSGSTLLLIDEDRSATNFMIRDRMMKSLIRREPIMPFTDRVNELYRERGVSTILVIGGSGEYLSVADRVYMMEDYLIGDVTERSRSICYANGVVFEPPMEAQWSQRRVSPHEGFTSYPAGSGSERLEVWDMGMIVIGNERIDVRGLQDVVTPRQWNALGFMLRYLTISNRDRVIDLEARIDELYARIEREGLDLLYSSYFTTCERFLDLPRKQELLSLIRRMRKVRFEYIKE